MNSLLLVLLLSPFAQNRDTVISVDMSLSLVGNPEATNLPPSDPQGLHWDGIDFIINSAGSGDRIGLQIFRFNSIMVSRLIDPSGMVHLDREYTLANQKKKTGRAWMLDLVHELREFEQTTKNGPPRNELEIPFVGKPFLFTHGTSSLLALRALDKLQVFKVDDNRENLLILFTDGMEEFSYGFYQNDIAKFKSVYDVDFYGSVDELDFDAVKDLANIKNDAKQFAKFLNSRCSFLQQTRTPLIAFGLGANCDMKLLEGLASSSGFVRNKSGKAIAVKSNIDLFDKMRDFQWDWSEKWVKKINYKSQNKNKNVSLSFIKEFKELDFYGYRIDSDGIASAPGGEKPNIVDSAAGFIPQSLYRSSGVKSHWYYSFVFDNFDTTKFTNGFVDFPEKNGDLFACFGVRAQYPDFTRVKPDGVKYSVKEPVPFGFRCISNTKLLKAEFFDLEVVARKKGGESSKRTDLELRVPLSFKVGPTDEGVFSGNLTFDGSFGFEGLVDKYSGDWEYDVIATGKSNVEFPLSGFFKRVFTGTFQVGGLPGVQFSKDQLVFKNSNPRVSSLEVKPLIQVSAFPSVENISLVTKFVPETKFAWAGGSVSVQTKGSFTTGSEKVITVQLDQNVYRKLDNGKVTLGKLVSQLPWGVECSLPIEVEKVSYSGEVLDKNIVLDFSGKKKVLAEPVLRLVSNDKAEEKVAVYLGKNNEDLTKPTVVEFRPVSGEGKSNPVIIQCALKGKEITLNSDGPTRVGLSLELVDSEKPMPGEYIASFLCRGESVAPIEFSIRLLFDQVITYVKTGAEWVPSTAISFPVLAGSKVHFPVKFSSSIGQSVGLESFEKLQFRNSQIVSDIVSSQIQDLGRNSGLDLQFMAPEKIHQGVFLGKLNVKLLQGLTQTGVSVPVSFHLIQYGLETPSKLPLNLGQAEKGGYFFAKFDVMTPEDGTTVRWTIKNSVLKSDQGNLPIDLIQVYANGKRIDNLEPQVSNPISKGKPVNFELRVDSSRLDVGIYSGDVKIFPFAVEPKGTEGAPLVIPFHFVKSGRKITVSDGNDSEKPFVFVEQRCFGDIKPEVGFIKVDGISLPFSENHLIDQKNRKKINKDLSASYFYKIPLPNLKAGVYEVQAEVDSGLGEGKSVEKSVISIFKSGAVNVSPKNSKSPRSVFMVDDTAVVTIEITPFTRQKFNIDELVVAGMKRGVKEGFTISLKDDGLGEDKEANDGIFSGTFPVKETGEFDFKFQPGKNWPSGLGIRNTDMISAFEMKSQRNDIGKLVYGAGIFGLFIGATGEITEPDVVKLTNLHQARKAQWTAEIIYPKNVSDVKKIHELDASLVPSEKYNGKVHLKTTLMPDQGATTDVEPEPDSVFQSNIDSGQTVTFGLNVQLSKEAEDYLFGNSEEENDEEGKPKPIKVVGPHPAFSGQDAVILKLSLQYDIADTETKVGPSSVVRTYTRDIYVPISFKTESWRDRGLLLAGVVILSLLGVMALFVWYWFRQGKDGRTGGQRFNDWLTKMFTSNHPQPGVPNDVGDGSDW
jgi:hypothetical protein